MLAEAYGDSASSGKTCRDWFNRFKDGNFNLSDKNRKYRPRKVKDHKLQVILDKSDTQWQKMLAEQLGITETTISIIPCA